MRTRVVDVGTHTITLSAEATEGFTDGDWVCFGYVPTWRERLRPFLWPALAFLCGAVLF